MRTWMQLIDEPGLINEMFTGEEIRESHEIARDLRIKDNAQELFKAIAQIKELIDVEPFCDDPHVVYEGIRILATDMVNKMEGRP